MNRAQRAIFRSKAVSVAATMHLEADEIVQAAIGLAIDHAEKAGIDRRQLHALLDDALAAAAVEGGGAE